MIESNFEKKHFISFAKKFGGSITLTNKVNEFYSVTASNDKFKVHEDIINEIITHHQAIKIINNILQ